LLLLTADRPPELRDWGAGQTIDQLGLYGRYPRWVVEVPVIGSGSGTDAERYARRLASRSVAVATSAPAGPVHLNWPLREPLEPPLGAASDVASTAADPGLRFSRARMLARSDDVEALVACVRAHRRGVICAGPMDVEAEWVEALAVFARASGWPLLADPASQLRSGVSGAPVLTTGDALARAPGFAARMRPQVVFRVGDPPVSKAQRLWLEEAEPAEVWWLDEGGPWGEPSHRATRVVRGGGLDLLSSAARALSRHDGRASAWCREFERAESTARRAFERCLEMEVDEGSELSGLSALAVASRLVAALPPRARLFASNSMPIRLLDLGFATRAESIRVLVSRGASGIDGITSTALGVAAASARGERTVLLTGDLAFLHDLGGLLLATRESIDLTIVVLDDDGGGIFSFLPVAQQREGVHFDRLFRTPHGLDLARVAALFELDFVRVTSASELERALGSALDHGGVSLLHVPLDPEKSPLDFRHVLEEMTRAVDAGVGP
jgi:2-succinyl-5-enolpyruvyl-6-hydroxy-3-cyclohexene-1-carboxylate synthase